MASSACSAGSRPTAWPEPRRPRGYATLAASGGRVGAWGRTIGQVAVWLLLFEVTVRGLLMVPAVHERLAFRFGPESELLAWYYEDRQDGRFEVHPRLGWVEATAPHEIGVATGTFSPLGPREPAPSSRDKTPGRTRLLLLGDSFALGDDVADAEAWGARLIAHDPRLEVINLGVGGYDAGQVMLRWAEDGVAWQPDVVLIGVNGLMASRSLRWFTTWQRPVVRGERGVFTPEGVPVRSVDAMRWHVLTTPRAWQLLQMGRFALYEGEGRWQLGLQRAAAVTSHLVAQVRAAGAVPVLVTLPPVYALERGAEEGHYGSESYWVGPAPAPLVDLVPALTTVARRGRPIQQGTHWTPEVHDEVARLVLEGLATAGVLPPSPARPLSGDAGAVPE